MFCCLTLAGLVAVLSLLAGPANSQSTGFAGPIAGFVYSRAWRRIQPLIGVPGSTSVGFRRSGRRLGVHHKIG